jgi:hypothetical protein
VAQVSDRGFVGLTPELSLGEVERIVETEDGVEVLGQRLKVGLGLLNRNRCPSRLGGRGEGGGRSGKGEDGGSCLHVVSSSEKI